MAPIEFADPKKPWNPRKILGVDPMAESFTCVGVAPTRGYARCGWRLEWADRVAGKVVLDEMSTGRTSEERRTEQLRDLARHLLCKQHHQYQVGQKVQEWTAKLAESAGHIQEWNDMVDEIQTLRSENGRLMKILQRVKEAQSLKAARDVKKIRRFKSFSATQMKELSNLQYKHATLETDFQSLQLDHARSVSMQEQANDTETGLRGKLADMEKEAEEQKQELTEKSLDFEKAENELKEQLRKALSRAEKAEEREANLNKKFSDTEKTAMQLRKKVIDAEQDSKKKATEFYDQLSQAEKDSEEQKTGLRTQLRQAQQESKERETELTKERRRASRESEEKEQLRETTSKAEAAAQKVITDLNQKLRIAKQEVQDRETEISGQLVKAEQESQERNELREKITQLEEVFAESRGKKPRRSLRLSSKR